MPRAATTKLNVIRHTAYQDDECWGCNRVVHKGADCALIQYGICKNESMQRSWTSQRIVCLPCLMRLQLSKKAWFNNA